MSTLVLLFVVERHCLEQRICFVPFRRLVILFVVVITAANHSDLRGQMAVYSRPRCFSTTSFDYSFSF